MTPLLAALLRRALPDLRVLDLAAPTEGGLYPWMPEARVGLAMPDAVAPAERDLLARFRRGAGAWPLAGADPAEDAALAAGAPAAWGGAAHRLVVLGGAAVATAVGRWTVEAGAMVLIRPADAGRERIALVLGVGAAVTQLDLALPDGRLPGALPALEEAARAIAAADGQGGTAPAGWACAAREVAPRLGGLTLLAPASAARGWATALGPDHLLLDANGPRLRVLLGVLPPRPVRLRVALDPAAPAPALLVDGLRRPATLAATDDAVVLDAEFAPDGTAATVLGLAAAAGDPAPRVRRVELAPA